MGYAIFLFLLACLSALKGYWLYIGLAALLFGACGAVRACRCGTCPKLGAWRGLKVCFLLIVLIVPLVVTALMLM